MHASARSGGNHIASSGRRHRIAEITRPNPETVRDDVSMSIDCRLPAVNAGGMNHQHQFPLPGGNLDLLQRLSVQIRPMERAESGLYEGLYANGAGVRRT